MTVHGFYKRNKTYILDNVVTNIDVKDYKHVSSMTVVKGEAQDKSKYLDYYILDILASG